MAAEPARGTTQEAPSRIGSYRVDGVLARGAYGVVYRATTPDGQPLAVKTLHLVEERELESLRREAELLTQLKHPGVVSVLDSGVDRGIPWYAMELLQGGTLADVLAERPPLDRALRLVVRLCEPLAYLHGEGIVHRDLKPANVVVRDGDAPVIVDFGFISQFAGTTGREALQGGGELAGTVAYMSPEQIRAAFVDARSDLYALGCILYEAVTGQPPFRGAPHKNLDQHLNATPQRPSETTSDVPAGLDNLILRLLAKDARGRPGFADDVRRMLNGLRGAPDRPPAQKARSYLYRPSFVGRAEPMADVIDALQKAERGGGAFLVASGESGVGKTRFAMEAARLATSRRFDVVTATCAVMDAHAVARIEEPLAPLRPLLRAVADRCVAEGRASADRLVGRRAKVLAAYEPALRQTPGFAEQPDPPPLPPDGDRERALGAMLETVAAYLTDRRLLLILDDVQWADDLTIALLAMLRDGFVHRHPLVVLMACRTEDRRQDLDQLVGSPNVTTLEIARLSAETVKAIVSDMLAMPDPPWNLVRLLERDSQGNPFFVGEFLRGSVEAGFLRRSAAGEWRLEATDYIRDPVRGVLPISAGLKDVILRRLAALDDVTRGFVEAAAAVGREFRVEFAADLGEIPHAQQVSATADLLRAGRSWSRCRADGSDSCTTSCARSPMRRFPRRGRSDSTVARPVRSRRRRRATIRPTTRSLRSRIIGSSLATRKRPAATSASRAGGRWKPAPTATPTSTSRKRSSWTTSAAARPDPCAVRTGGACSPSRRTASATWSRRSDRRPSRWSGSANGRPNGCAAGSPSPCSKCCAGSRRPSRASTRSAVDPESSTAPRSRPSRPRSWRRRTSTARRSSRPSRTWCGA